MTQSKGAKPITEMRLSDPLSNCGKGKVSAAAKTRQLFGDTNKGRFRTRGRHASATVRGTRWVTKDSCKSTTVKVTRGTVIVRDFTKRKNVTVKRGHSYTARAK
jgi:ferric-dicitrate binding protein FerR (iron transport regulator)